MKKPRTSSRESEPRGTNRDLTSAVAKGELRHDLFYRLNFFRIRLPAWRERISDTCLLVGYQIDRYAKKLGKKIRNIDEKTVEAACRRPVRLHNGSGTNALKFEHPAVPLRTRLFLPEKSAAKYPTFSSWQAVWFVSVQYPRCAARTANDPAGLL